MYLILISGIWQKVPVRTARAGKTFRPALTNAAFWSKSGKHWQGGCRVPGAIPFLSYESYRIERHRVRLKKDNAPMKRICLPLLVFAVVLLIVPAPGSSQERFLFGIQANRSAVELYAESQFDTQPSTVYLGANGLYYEDKYSIFGIHTMVGNVISRGLRAKIGFKGVAGEFKRTRHKNPDLLALGFSISGSYDLSEVIATHYVPVIFHATISYSPRPMSFDDTERFFEALLAADWMFLENAAITAGARYLDVDFGQWERSHGSGYLGFKFVF